MPEQIETVVHHADDQRADQRAGDAADAAGKAGAADDDGGDRVEFIGNAGLRQGRAGAGARASCRRDPKGRPR